MSFAAGKNLETLAVNLSRKNRCTKETNLTCKSDPAAPEAHRDIDFTGLKINLISYAVFYVIFSIPIL